jgi:hypothetical protein
MVSQIISAEGEMSSNSEPNRRMSHKEPQISARHYNSVGSAGSPARRAINWLKCVEFAGGTQAERRFCSFTAFPPADLETVGL